MVRSILIGVDGSPHGEAAVEFGLRWAAEYMCRLTGLSIINEPGISCADQVSIRGGDCDRIRIQKASAQSAQWLDAFSARCNLAGVAASAVTESGDPVAVLALESQGHDLVLLGR
jgi:hypothetical protein